VQRWCAAPASFTAWDRAPGFSLPASEFRSRSRGGRLQP